MSAMPSPMQAGFSGSLPVKPPLDPPALHPGSLHGSDLDDGPLSGEQPDRGRQHSLGFVSLFITFCVGVGLTVAWYSFGGPLRETIAGMSPELAWLAPQPAGGAPSAADPAAPAAAAPAIDQQLNAASLDLDAVRQNVDRIATSQEQIKRSIDQLSVGQEQLTKEIAKLQAVEQYILYKNSEPPATRSAPPPAAGAASPVRRPAAPLPLTPAPQAPPR